MSYYVAVAATYSQGVALRSALAALGVHVGEPHPASGEYPGGLLVSLDASQYDQECWDVVQGSSDVSAELTSLAAVSEWILANYIEPPMASEVP